MQRPSWLRPADNAAARTAYSCEGAGWIVNWRTISDAQNVAGAGDWMVLNDRATLLEHLVQAERHVAQGEAHIGRQEALVAELELEVVTRRKPWPFSPPFERLKPSMF